MNMNSYNPCSDHKNSQLEAYKIFFGSLAHHSRLHIINLLRAGPRNVTEISKETGLEQTLVSHNLKRLERCGMVFVQQRGKQRYYSVNSETIKPLMELIDRHTNMYCRHILDGTR